MKPVVSVIIPVHNAEKTIEKCVESLALGRMRELEIILVDDCSDDGSWELCRELALRFSQVKCIRNEENRGVSYSRNRGLEEASGEYVCFVDSDDWVSECYLEELICAAKQDPDALIVCGLHFLNRVEDYRRTYLWSPEGARFSVEKKDFFVLHEKLLLPQVWNKVFRWDVIEDHHLRFDENQSMGEDFQFVLDYLQAAGIGRCVILNRPLYYYTRNSSATLMSGFGQRQREAEFARFKRLRDFLGDEPVAQEQYERAVDGLKRNLVYQTVRLSDGTKNEQLAMIKEIVGDDQSFEYYRQLQIVRLKEFVMRKVWAVRSRAAFVKGEQVRKSQRKKAEKAREKIRNLEIPMTIISQNCIGGVFYRDMGMQFASPTVGLFLQGSDFVRFASNLREYLAKELRMRWGEEYPIGSLGDIEIHFRHYETCKQAENAWNRRCERINWNRIVVCCTDRDGFSDEDFDLWRRLPYPKILFTANERYRKHPDSVFLNEYRRNGVVGDVIPGRKFYRGGSLVNTVNWN